MIESYLSKNIPNQPPRGNLDLRLATETVFRDEMAQKNYRWRDLSANAGSATEYEMSLQTKQQLFCCPFKLKKNLDKNEKEVSNRSEVSTDLQLVTPE